MHSTEHSHPLCSVFALVHEGPQWLMLTCPCIQTLHFLSPLQSLPVEIPVTKLFGHYRVQNSPTATHNSTTPKHWILKKSQRATTLKVTTLGQQRDVLFQYFQSIFTANPKFHLCFQLKTSSTAKLLPEALGTSERAEIWRRFSYRTNSSEESRLSLPVSLSWMHLAERHNHSVRNSRSTLGNAEQKHCCCATQQKLSAASFSSVYWSLLNELLILYIRYI